MEQKNRVLDAFEKIEQAIRDQMEATANPYLVRIGAGLIDTLRSQRNSIQYYRDEKVRQALDGDRGED